MEQVVILMALNIDGEGVEAIGKGFVAKFLLPRSPLVIKDVVEGWHCIALLPLIKEVNIG